MCDRDANAHPREEYDVTPAVQDYLRLTNAPDDEVLRFLRRHKVVAAFPRKGSLAQDVPLFSKAKQANFRHKKLAHVEDNLHLYLPLAERVLLVGPGLAPDGTFSPEQADRPPLFHYDALRAFFLALARRSLDTLQDLMPLTDPDGKALSHLYRVKR